jgi:hypothetical protein
MTCLEAAEMRFLRSAKGYTRQDKIRSKIIRKELEISGKQEVSIKNKQNWNNHLERMDSTRLPKHAFTNLEEEEIVNAPGNAGNASMSEQFKRPNPLSEMIMMMICSIQVALY